MNTDVLSTHGICNLCEQLLAAAATDDADETGHLMLCP